MCTYYYVHYCMHALFVIERIIVNMFVGVWLSVGYGHIVTWDSSVCQLSSLMLILRLYWGCCRQLFGIDRIWRTAYKKGKFRNNSCILVLLGATLWCHNLLNDVNCICRHFDTSVNELWTGRSLVKVHGFPNYMGFGLSWLRGLLDVDICLSVMRIRYISMETTISIRIKRE